MPIACKGCQQLISDDAPECPSCGTALDRPEPQEEILAGSATGPLRGASTQLLADPMLTTVPAVEVVDLVVLMTPYGNQLKAFLYPAPLRATRKICNALERRISHYLGASLLIGVPLTVRAVFSRLATVPAETREMLKGQPDLVVTLVFLALLLASCAIYGRRLLARLRPKARPFGTLRVTLSIAVSLAIALLVLLINGTNSAELEEAQQAAANAKAQDLQLQQDLDALATKVRATGNAIDISDLRGPLADILNDERKPSLERRFGAQAGAILQDGQRFLDETASASATLDDASRQQAELKPEVDQNQKQLDEMRSRLMTRSFTIIRQFDFEARTGKGYYEAADEAYHKCVVIAYDKEVSTGGLSRTTLAVTSRGTMPVPVTYSNAYQNYQTTEYFPAYESSDETHDIEERERTVSEERRRLMDADVSATQARATLGPLVPACRELIHRLISST